MTGKKSGKIEYPCGVVVRKKAGGRGTTCKASATQVIALSKSDSAEIDSYIFLCDSHDKKLEGGKSLIVVDSKGNKQLIKRDLDSAGVDDV